MSTPFEIKSFDQYLNTVDKELGNHGESKRRLYFRGQSKRATDGYPSQAGPVRRIRQTTVS